jgi:hypothetical protein
LYSLFPKNLNSSPIICKHEINSLNVNCVLSSYGK